GAIVPEIGAAWTRALEIAESLYDTEHQLRSLWGLWLFHTASSQHRLALALAQKFSSVATSVSDPNDRLIGDRLSVVSQHWLADQLSARRCIERMLGQYVVPASKSHVIRFQSDQRATAHAFLARVLWLQGFPDQAARTVETAIDEARATDHAN